MKKLTKKEFDNLDEKQQEIMLQKIGEVQEQMQKGAEEDAKLPQLDMKEFEGKVKSIIEDQMKGMTPVDKKYFMMPGIGTKDADDITPEAKFAKTKRFLGALVGKDTQVLNQMHQEVVAKANLSEGTGSAGGFLVPEEFKAEILRLVPLYGVIRANSRYIPMISDTTHIPRSVSDTTAKWVSEAGTIASTDAVLGQVTLTINKLASITSMTSELLADANIPIISYLSETIAEQFGQAEDEQGFNGTGSPFTGVLNNTGSPQTQQGLGTTVGSLAYGDLVNMTGSIYANAKAGAKFYMNRSVATHIRSLISTTGQPIFGFTANQLGDYAMVDTEVMPGAGDVSGTNYNYVVYGDLRKGHLFGERGSITMALSSEGTVGANNLFEKDMSALRVIERVCMGVALQSAYTQLRT